jgi:hypothetical protein
LYGFINSKGKVVIDFCFAKADNFSNGLSVVTNSDGKNGLIDLSGKLIVPFELDEVTKSNNVLRLEKNGKFAYFHPITRMYIWKEEGF